MAHFRISQPKTPQKGDAGPFFVDYTDGVMTCDQWSATWIEGPDAEIPLDFEHPNPAYGPPRETPWHWYQFGQWVLRSGGELAFEDEPTVAGEVPAMPLAVRQEMDDYAGDDMPEEGDDQTLLNGAIF